MNLIFALVGKIVILATVMALQVYLFDSLFVKEKGANRRLRALWLVMVSVAQVAFVLAFPIVPAWEVIWEGAFAIGAAFGVVVLVAWRNIRAQKAMFRTVMIPILTYVGLFLYYFFIY